MNGAPKPRRLKTFEREREGRGCVKTNKSCFLLFCLTSGVDEGSEDVAGHLGVLPLNQRLIKRTFRGMD